MFGWAGCAAVRGNEGSGIHRRSIRFGLICWLAERNVFGYQGLPGVTGTYGEGVGSGECNMHLGGCSDGAASEGLPEATEITEAVRLSAV
jgi:hypothetical protein